MGIFVNALYLISPYKTDGIWAFDDPAAGLQREPFVDKVNDFIDRLSADIPDAEAGFCLIFSARPFPGYAMHLQRVKEEYDGNWYACQELDGALGWLCPALLKYFDSAPEALYVKAQARA